MRTAQDIILKPVITEDSMDRLQANRYTFKVATGRYSNTSDIEKGQNFLDPESEKEGLFGYQQAFSKEMIKELYGTLAHYREMAEKNTKEQVTKGFVCREDAAELVEIAVQLAKKRGLE